MSIRLFWNKLSDEENVVKLQQFLNHYFDTKIEKPDYIGNIRVTQLRLGTKEPIISILEIADVFEEFYFDELAEEHHGSNEQEFELMRGRLECSSSLIRDIFIIPFNRLFEESNKHHENKKCLLDTHHLRLLNFIYFLRNQITRLSRNPPSKPMMQR